jgi:drug/metabolite transporter (DMT)-like permease
VPPLALAFVAVAAVLHAGWNVLLKTSGDPLRTAVRLQAFGSLVLVPVAVVAWLVGGRVAIDPRGVAIAIGSGVLEAAYFVFLSAAYRRGDLSLVYPIARGSAPLLAVAFGVGVLGERLGSGATLGVVCLLGGILAVARPWRAFREAGREHRGAIGFALATGVTIAAYSAVDRVGVRIIEPWQYGAILAIAATIILSVTVTFGRRWGLLAPAPVVPAGSGTGSSSKALLRDGAAGVLSLIAYLLILVAYSMAPLAAVAPLRESAIVLAAAWGSFRLGESSGRAEGAIRIGAAALVVVGAVLLATGR